MGERAMRPFWIHQLVEYLIGLALVFQGLQGPEPLVPSIAGALVAVNAAIVRGPLGAFRFVGRRVHRWLDVVVMAAILLGAVQPWLDVDAGSRLIMLVLLIPLGFLWWYTDWAERVARKERRAAGAEGGTGERVGRSAGRFAAGAYLAGKRAVKKRSDPDGRS
jgi:hypothetical protein